MKSVLALGTALAFAIASPVAAAQVTYTVSGLFDGDVDGTPFGGSSAVFTGIGDTDTLTNLGSGIVSISLSSLSAVFGGTTYDFGSAAQFQYYTSARVAGFTVNSTSPILFSVKNFDPAQSYAPTSVDFVTSYGSQVTSQGTVTIESAANLVFQATVDDAAAVPEPATWGMMLVGFGLVGAGMRRRKTVAVAA